MSPGRYQVHVDATGSHAVTNRPRLYDIRRRRRKVPENFRLYLRDNVRDAWQRHPLPTANSPSNTAFSFDLHFESYKSE